MGLTNTARNGLFARNEGKTYAREGSPREEGRFGLRRKLCPRGVARATTSENQTAEKYTRDKLKSGGVGSALLKHGRADDPRLSVPKESSSQDTPDHQGKSSLSPALLFQRYELTSRMCTTSRIATRDRTRPSNPLSLVNLHFFAPYAKELVCSFVDS